MSANKKQAIACILSAAFFFAVMNLFVRLAGDLPVWQKSLFRNLMALLIASAVILKNRHAVAIPKTQLPYMLIRCTAGTIGILCNFYAVSTINIADASMLNKLSPFFAILFSLIILKEKPKKLDWFCLFLAFIGALFVMKPSFSLDSIPAFIGLLGGVGAGLAYTCVRKMGTHGVDGAVIVFWFSLFSCLSVLPGMLLTYVPMSRSQLLLLLAAGTTAACAQFSITAAYSKAAASEISVYDYTQVIFTAFLSLAVLREIPDYLSVIGYLIIIGAAFWKWKQSQASA
ncbi:MAG: DMT family transporter [Lachnospiraceae bacterium]|nr:DMT family transporter [Lachnospiraceae bacterium]